jgi:hypothetical protein
VLIINLSSSGSLGSPSVTEAQVKAAFSEVENPAAPTFGQHFR